MRKLKFKWMRFLTSIDDKMKTVLGDINIAPLKIDLEDDDFIWFELAYPGLPKEAITFDTKNHIMTIVVNVNFSDSQFRKYWSCKRMKAFYDFTGYDVNLDTVITTFDKSILTIRVEKVKKEVVRKRWKL